MTGAGPFDARRDVIVQLQPWFASAHPAPDRTSRQPIPSRHGQRRHSHVDRPATSAEDRPSGVVVVWGCRRLGLSSTGRRRQWKIDRLGLSGVVVFTYKDYRHEHRQRTLTLAANEFIRRFMMHVVPNGFMRIRYYGFLANTHRQQQLRKIRELLHSPPPASDDQHDEPPDDQVPLDGPSRCPHCQQGMMWPIDMAPRPRLAEILDLPLLVPT